MKHTLFAAVLVASLAFDGVTGSPAGAAQTPRAASVITWSNEARRAIVPAGPGGVYGPENYGNKFPGEAAVYMGIVHGAIYDAALAASATPGSSDAAVATAAHHVLIGLQPALGLSAPQQAGLDARYSAYLAGIAESNTRVTGIALGERVAAAALARRLQDGREKNPELTDLEPPAAGPGVWDPGALPALGLRLPGLRPLVLERPSQFRPAGPNTMASDAYARDFEEVRQLGFALSRTRTPAQTVQALFWTDHDLRQWNDALLKLAADHNLDLLRTARLLAIAHVSGGDAMIACFDAKYAYWFWRPDKAIPSADVDGNPATTEQPEWQPLRDTPNFPEYPSAHACHSSAIAEALEAFFGTNDIPFSIDSRVTGTRRVYQHLRDVVDDVDGARVFVGFHFRSSDRDGASLGRKVARYVISRRFARVANSSRSF